MTKTPNKKGAPPTAVAASQPVTAHQGADDGVKQLSVAGDQELSANGVANNLTPTGDTAVDRSQDNGQGGQALGDPAAQLPAGDQAGVQGGPSGDTSAQGGASDAGGVLLATLGQAQVLDIDQAESNLSPTSSDLLHAGERMLGFADLQYTYGVEISATRDGFRRAGRAWYREPTFIQEGDLSQEQVDQLLAEPNIRCVPARRAAVAEGESQ